MARSTSDAPPKVIRRIKVEVRLTEHTNMDTYGGNVIVEADTNINLPVPGGAAAIVALIEGQVTAIMDAATDLPLTTPVLLDPRNGDAEEGETVPVEV